LHRRDTTMVVGEGEHHMKPHQISTRGCGYTVVRFTVDNPGAWAFHCHAEWHAVMGMFAVFYTAPETIPEPDGHHTICGAVSPKIIIAKQLEAAKRLSTAETPDDSTSQRNGISSTANTSHNDHRGASTPVMLISGGLQVFSPRLLETILLASLTVSLSQWT